MTWLLAIALALAVFSAAVLVLKVDKRGWSAFGAALALGLAGYALQASPGIAASPTTAPKKNAEIGSAMIDARRVMTAENRRSRSPLLISADAFARNGQYANAVTLLGGAVSENPNDGEAWLALGNALISHADGALSPPALYALRRASEADPSSIGPGYVLGVALIGQNQPGQARAVWRETLAAAPADAAGRAELEALLARFDQALQASGGAVSPAP